MQIPSAVKFIYSEKATKFYEISTLLLSKVHTDKSKVEISKNFVAFSEYTNFISNTERDSIVSSKFRCHFTNKMIVKFKLSKTYFTKRIWYVEYFIPKSSLSSERPFIASL